MPSHLIALSPARCRVVRPPGNLDRGQSFTIWLILIHWYFYLFNLMKMNLFWIAHDVKMACIHNCTFCNLMSRFCCTYGLDCCSYCLTDICNFVTRSCCCFYLTAGDWLQGPYVYALYQYYHMSKHDIEVLFVAGFGSSMIFGTFVGSIADK